MTNTETSLQIAVLLDRQRGHLRDARRAQRDADDAEFFGDHDDCSNYLQVAKDATDAALICADEIADLAGFIQTPTTKE